MVLLESSRRTYEGVAAQTEDVREPLAPRGPFPDGWICVDLLPDLIGDLRLRTPQADTHVALARLEVEVETGSVRVLGHDVTELHPCVLFVRRLVLAESRVALDSEQRPADLSCIGHEMLGDTFERGGEIVDEVERRFSYISLVGGLMRLEPVAVVVFIQIVQEPKQPGSEVCIAHAENIPIKLGLCVVETY